MRSPAIGSNFTAFLRTTIYIVEISSFSSLHYSTALVIGPQKKALRVFYSKHPAFAKLNSSRNESPYNGLQLMEPHFLPTIR